MNNFKKFLLPAVMVLAGAGSAYATHATKDNAKVIRQGYAFHSGANPECIRSSKQCDTGGDVICTGNVGMGTEVLYDLNGSVCQSPLKERVVK